MRTANICLITSFVCLSIACITPQPTCEPGSPQCSETVQRITLTPTQAEAQLADIDTRYALARADGLDASECEELSAAYQAVYERGGVLLARFNVAVLHEACGQPALAEPIYVELAEREFSQALNNLGVIAWRRGQQDRAAELFARAVEADRTHGIAARNNLAAVLRERYASAANLADFEQAERQLQNILAVDSSNKLAYENLARLYYDRGHAHDPSYLVLANLVVDQAQKVLAANGESSADLHNIRGLLLMATDDQVRALRAFRSAIEVDPAHADANRNLALIALRFRDYDTAERSLEVVLPNESVATDPDAWIALGVAKRGLRKFDEAEQAYRHALTLDSNDPRPWYNLGILAQEHLSARVEGDEMIAMYARARGHYESFLQVAGTTRRWRTEVADANDRIAIIDDTIQTIREGTRIAEEYEKMLALERKQREEQIERWRQLEQSGTSIEELTGE